MYLSITAVGAEFRRCRSFRGFMARAAAFALFVALVSPAFAGGSKDAAPSAAPAAQAPAAGSAGGDASGPAKAPSRLFEPSGDPYYKSPNHASIDKASLENQSAGLAADWWADSSFYHIWVKSFADYDGDGVGDFRGITSKLDYLKDILGVDALWLSPVFDCAYKGSSPTANMHGYDTVDYYEVNDYFGNKEHLATLLAEAHRRGMKVIFDFVPNHTSNQHPWFVQSANFDPEKKDWYLWNDKRLAWSPMGNSGTWHRSDLRQAYYYGAFSNAMPDLNYRNAEVREEMKNVVRYWLDFGFDGLRIDAVRYLVEDGGGAAGTSDIGETHEFFAELRREVVDAYAGLGHPKFMVAEAWINGDRPRLNAYFGSLEKPEFQMLFDFDFSGKVTSAVKYKNRSVFEGFFPSGAGQRYGVFLSNHDNLSSRPGTVFSDPRQLRLASALSLLMPATPFVYYGNEIGQADKAGLSGQDLRLRYPFDWSSQAAQAGDPASLLALHRDLLALRSSRPALRRGEWKNADLGLGAHIAAWTLTLGNDTVLCAANLGSDPVAGVPAAAKAILGAGRVRALYDGDLGNGETLAQYGFAVYGVEK